jgi:hypothetical protein
MSEENLTEAPLLFDRYQIQGKLGSGAYATVYLAHDEQLGRDVAIKVVEDSRDVDRRALREAQAAAKLDHGHVVHLYEVVRQEGRTLLFTEYVQGHTLRELFAKRRLSDRDVLEAGIQMCRALEHAHKRGVVHRDIKPENVMVVEGDEIDVRVMDFGVAHLEDLTSITMDGDLVGTLAYMAPEQLEGGTVGRKADVYALSLTLYEGLTGSNPFRGMKPAEILKGSSRASIEPLRRRRPDLPVALEDALGRGLQQDPELRPSPAELRRELERSMAPLVDSAPEPAMTRRETLARRVGGRLDTLRYVSEHAIAGALSLAMTAYLLPRIPFYPEAAVLPLAVVAAFASLLSPVVGGILTLALVAPPIFAFGVGWGVLYVATAAPVFGVLRWRRREWAALLPGAVPVLVSLGVGLSVPVLAGYLLRRWGPLCGALAGLALAVAAGFEGWDPLPYTFSQGIGPVLLADRYAGSPGDALEGIAQLLDLRPELLLQIGLFSLFAVPIARYYSGPWPRRLWTVSLYSSALYAGFLLLPPILLGVPVDLRRFAVAFIPCVIIAVLLALLTPSEGMTAGSEA